MKTIELQKVWIKGGGGEVHDFTLSEVFSSSFNMVTGLKLFKLCKFLAWLIRATEVEYALL